MAIVKDTTTEKTSILDVPITCEILVVFPYELPCLPPHRDIEFCIDVVSDTAPNSMPPYRMASTKLRELKE